MTDVAPWSAFRYETIDFESPTQIAQCIQDVADEVVPSVVFIGTDNVGEIAEPLTSVAGSVAADAEYDVHVVRYFSPTETQELEAETDAYPST